jgi:hypothetical protein
VRSVQRKEGNSGNNILSFQVRLSMPSSQPVVVNVSTRDGTAQEGSDYQALDATVKFAPGEIVKIVRVTLSGDMVPEDDETFSVDVEAPPGYNVGPSATGTILDDD